MRWARGLLIAVTALVLAPAGARNGEESDAETPLDPRAAIELLDQRGDAHVIDVRTPQEYAAGHLADAALIDIQAPDFLARIDRLDRDRTYLLYCRSGNRSAHAARIMRALGFREVYNAGGYDDLAAAGATVS